MKVVILAGGLGSRMGEETEIKPKPMIEIGGKPILWHIMCSYSAYGFNQFVIALGSKGEMIKRYMVDYVALNSDLTVSLKDGQVILHDQPENDWLVELFDTGINTKTGGRLKRLMPFLKNETFMLTWGDSLSNINLRDLMRFHQSHGKLATVTAVRPTARYGYMDFEDDKVIEFSTRPQFNEGWMNGGFFVLEPGVFDYIDGDDSVWEMEPLERLARDGQLMAYKHDSFWYCIDTPRERHVLENLWETNQAPWKIEEE